MSTTPSNPYTPPASPLANPDDQGHRPTPGRAITWFVVAASVMEVLLDLLLVASPSASPGARRGLNWFLSIVIDLRLILILAWVHAAWRGIPSAFRGTMSPWRAVLSYFIPVYNFYWGIAMNLALCDTLNVLLKRMGSERRAPRNLAIVAYAAWLAVSVGFIVDATLPINARHLQGATAIAVDAVVILLWPAYMVLCDYAREPVARIGDDVDALGPPTLGALQRAPRPGVAAWIGAGLLLVLAIFGLAIWQVLQPGPPRPH